MAARQISLPFPGAYALREVSEQFAAELREAAAAVELKVAAADLDDIFGEAGRPVSASLLGNCLRGDNRNYARAEWVPYLVSLPSGRDALRVLADVAGFDLVPKAKPLTDTEKLRKIEAVLDESGPLGFEIKRRAGL